jgi:hypothetical protein
MLGRKQFLRLRNRPQQLADSPGRDLERILQDQNQLAGVDVAIADSKEALRRGRRSVGRTLLAKAQEHENDGDAAALLQAGRQGVLQQIAAQGSIPSEMSFDPNLARRLADELHRELVRLTSTTPYDRLAAQSLEIQIQTCLRAYANSIQRLLTPVTFR